MQAFGKYATSYDNEYLIQHFVYIAPDEEKITTQDLDEMLKKKRKTVSGTIFLFNPCIAPLGYNTNTTLASQGFEFDNNFHELNYEEMHHLIYQAMKKEYMGKLVEIKYLFNLNLKDVQKTSVIDKFEIDLDRYNSQQLTIFDREHNYHDVLNIRLTGKFVFFVNGHKYDKEYTNTYVYAKNLASQAAKLGKKVVFIYDRNYNEDEALNQAYFLEPIVTGKAKAVRSNAFKKAFETNPPEIQRID
jgi:hypothetical protein